MKKHLLFLIAMFLAIPLSAGVFSSYDFTFYKTADKSMNEFSKQAVGVDYTGYGYIGSSSMEGIYLRLGVQTPYDNLIQTILELREEMTRRASLEGEALSSPSSTLDSEIADSYGTGTSSLLVIPDSDQSEQSSTDDTQATTEKPLERIKDEWAFSITVGPAYRSFMGDDATVYFGLGASNSINLVRELLVNTEFTKTSFSDTLGVDVDFGIRFNMKSTTAIRIGTHFTADVIGWESITTKDQANEIQDSSLEVYGYAFVGDSIFSTLDGVWYIRLARTYRSKVKYSYTYVNRTRGIGMGEIYEVVEK